MTQQHPPAAIPLQTESVESVSLLVLSLEETEVSLPLVSDDFAAGETSDGNYHNAGGLDFLKYFYPFIS